MVMPQFNADQQLKDFKKFAFTGRLYETAIGFVMGAAANKVASATVEFFLMPFVGFFFGSAKTWQQLTWTPVPQLTFPVGHLVSATSDFILTALILFFVYKKMVGLIVQKDTKICPDCCTEIAAKAVRCPSCTTYLNLEPKHE